MAYGVSVGAELTYGWEDQSAILVTVSPELNIVVCASETSPARYIDILHDQIESVSLEKRQRISQTNTVVQEDLVILVVWLTKSSDTTLYVGAGKRFASSISIAFTSLDEAAAITKRLLERAPHIVEKFTCSESEPLSLSQPMVETIEEQGVLFNADSHIDTIRPAIVTSATDSVSLPAFIRTPKPDLIHSFLNWPKNVSASLLQTADLSDLRSNTGISIEDIQIESILSRSHSPTKNLEDRSGGSRRDSAEWRKGAILIDFDPELQDATNHVLKEGGLLGINSSPVQLKLSKRDSDRDSFYDATPRVQNAILEHADQVRTHSQGCQGLKKSLEVSLMPITTPQVMDKSCKAENSRNTGGGAAKLVVQAPEKEEFINGNAGDVHNLGAVRKKYTSKRKLLPTNASQKIAFGKNCTDRKANSLSVKIGCFQRHERGENEFDFPLSPQKTRTPKNAWRPVLKKLLSKEGAISPAPEKKTLNNRSLPPEKGDPLVPDVVVRNKHQGVLPSMASFRQRNSKSFNDESTGVKWDEGLVVDGKPSGADPDPPRKGSRGKAKWVTKRSKNKDNEAYSSKQGSEETMRKTNKKTRSAPRPAPRPRNRRAAALIADQRIKNTIDCNTSQEQGRGELVHEVETARPKSSQEASSPSILAGSNLNFDHGVSQQANAQHLFTLIENRNLNHDEMPEIASGSELRPRDGDCEIIANANATELAGNPKRRPVVIFGNSTLQCVPVNDMNGMTHINDGDGRAKEGQLSGHTSSMASPRSGVFLRGDNGAIPFREPIIENNGAEGLLISRSRSESPSLSHLHILDTARETCSSDKLVSALALPDSSDKLVSAFALSDSQRNSHVGPAFQREDAFALSLRKALSNVPLSNEHHHHTLEAQLDPSGPALYSRAALRNQTCRVRQNSKRPRMSRQPFVYETPVAQTAPPLTPLHSYHRVAGDDRSLKRASRGSETDPVHEKRPRTSSSSITDVTDRPSSRGTRVTPDGSPMKSVISPADSLKLNEEYECTLLEQRLSMKVNAKDPFGLIDKSDPGPVISPLHLRRRKAEMRSWRRSSGKNSKHRKSLDGSKSSGASQLTAHRIHPNGGFINIHTEAAVVPIEPANPFLETRKAYAKKAENDDFMRILRESCNLSDNQNICLGLNGLEESHDSTDPPSTECSSSDRSSRKRRVSSASTTDEEESLHEEAVERRDLTSHQKTQIDALFKVSRVSQTFPGNPKPKANAMTFTGYRGRVDQTREEDRRSSVCPQARGKADHAPVQESSQTGYSRASERQYRI